MSYLRNLLGFFDRRTHWQLAGLAALMLVMALLEMAGLSLFLPLFDVIARPDDSRYVYYIDKATRLLGAGSREELMLGFALVIFLFFVVKNSALFGLSWFQNHFVLAKQADFQARVFHHYLSLPYARAANQNSAEIVRNITQSAAMIFTRALLPLVNVVMESAIGVAVFVVLLAVEPLATGFVGLGFGVIALVYYGLTREPLRRWSEQREHLAAQMIRTINHGVGSLKEIKLMGRGEFFSSSLWRAALEQGSSQAKTTTFTQAPRLVTETFAVGALGGVLLIMLLQGRPISDVTPALGLFVLATFRLVPTFNRILSNLATARSAAGAVNSITQDFAAYRASLCGLAGPGSSDGSRPSWSRIRIRIPRFTYDGADRPALTDVDVTIARGESIGIVGPSGVGKSTLVDLLLGLLDPGAGSISLDGHDVREHLAGWQRTIGYVPQGIFLIDDTLRCNIALGLPDAKIDEAAVLKAAHAAQLDDMLAALPLGLDTVVGERGARLSGGQRQRIGIARALYNDPDILVFDEATSALDNETERAVSDAIAALGHRKTLVVIAHRLSTVHACDRLILLDHGRVAADGNFDELMLLSARFRALFEHPQAVISSRAVS